MICFIVPHVLHATEPLMHDGLCCFALESKLDIA